MTYSPICDISNTMKTITLTVRDDTKITVDGVEYPTKAEVKLWTPKPTESYWFLTETGPVPQICTDHEQHQSRLEAGNVFPTRESAEALDRKRRAEGVIFRYFYERGIDTRWQDGVDQYCVKLINGALMTDFYTKICYGSPFSVKSKEIAEQAIADIPDPIRTALLGGWV